MYQEETNLIRRCKKGDVKAFEQLVHTYSGMLNAVCTRYVKDRMIAKDALQECFISIYKNIKSYNEKGSFEAWMKRIAVTSSLKELRKKKKNEVSMEIINEADMQFSCDQPIAIEKLKFDEVLSTINLLPDEYRIAFNLFVIEGYSHAEIASLEKIDVSLSRARVSRARVKVQQLLLKNQDYYEFTTTRKVD